jgi:hypothetical protein
MLYTDGSVVFATFATFATVPAEKQNRPTGVLARGGLPAHGVGWAEF